MKTYYISITETLDRVVKVQAENDYDAIYKVSNAYYNGDIVLDSQDFVDTQFNDKTEETINNYENGEIPEFDEVK